MNKIYFVGCGGVGYALLEIFKKEKLYRKCKYVIIDPRTPLDLLYVMEGLDYEFLKVAMTRDNCKELLRDVDENTFVVNVSVDVDSLMILQVSKEKNAWYIDTSLEQYPDDEVLDPHDITSYRQFKRSNLYHQNLEAFKLMKGKGCRKTRAVSAGMNPGFINEFVKKSLKEYAKHVGKRLTKNNWAKLAHDCGLKEIQCVEYDSQKMKEQARSTPKRFIGTWSCIGLQEEAKEMVMLSLNNEDIADMERAGYKLIKPTEGGDTHIRFIPERGMNMKRRSVALDENGNPFEFEGSLIHHAEIISMSDFFTYRGDAPTIMYVYRTCDESLKSLEVFKERGYKNLTQYLVVRNDDVESGCDSIGALLVFKNGDRYIGATISGKQDAERMGFKSGATTIQVAGFMNAVIKWSLLHPMEGLNNTETIPHEYIFKHASKYAGKLVFKKL